MHDSKLAVLSGNSVSDKTIQEPLSLGKPFAFYGSGSLMLLNLGCNVQSTNQAKAWCLLFCQVAAWRDV